MERPRESCFARSTDTARWALHLGGVVPKAIRSEGTVVQGDSLVFVAGAPLVVRGTTNLMHLRRVKGRG